MKPHNVKIIFATLLNICLIVNIGYLFKLLAIDNSSVNNVSLPLQLIGLIVNLTIITIGKVTSLLVAD